MPRRPKTIEQQIAIREYRRRERERLGQCRVGHRVVEGPPLADVVARLAEIPVSDDRSLTARLMGDPLPGRATGFCR